MKQKRLIPIIITLVMFLNLILPIVNVYAETAATSVTTYTYNRKLYDALKERLNEQNIKASYNDLQRRITISNDEAAKVTQLDLSFKEISDLSGLEIFSNLRVLDLQSNELEDLTEDENKNLNVLKSLTNLVELNLNTNHIASIGDLSVSRLTAENQSFSQIRVIVADEEELDDDGCLAVDLPGIFEQVAGPLQGSWFGGSNIVQFPGAHPDLTAFVQRYIDFYKLGIWVGEYDADMNLMMHKGLIKVAVNIDDSSNPLNSNNSHINLYYLVIDSSERAALFKDRNFYNAVKEQLTSGQEINEELRTHISRGGADLYKDAYDEPMIMVFDLDTLINDIPSLNVNNKEVRDLSGLETFVGLESELDLSDNYINSIDKIIELQENKDLEEAKLQARYTKVLNKLKTDRAKLMTEVSKLKQIEKQIEEKEKAINAINEKIAKLDAATPGTPEGDMTPEAREEEKNKQLAALATAQDELAELETQKAEASVKVLNLLNGDVNSDLEALYNIYKKEYKATTLLTVKLNTVTNDEYRSAAFHDDISNIFNAEASKIKALEAADALTIEDENLLISIFGAVADNEHPIGAAIDALIQANADNANAASVYYNKLNQLYQSALESQFIEYYSIYKKYDDSTITRTSAIVPELNKKFLNTMEEFEKVYNGNTTFRGRVESNSTTAQWTKINNNTQTITEAGSDNVPYRYLMGLSGKLANLSQDEIKAYITLPDLKKVNISKNNIESIKGIDALTELVELNVATNRIVDLTEVTWSDIPKLKKLNLSHNLISEITALSPEYPDETVNIKEIRELYLADNLLSGEFNFGISKLKKLEIADFSENQYTDIKSFINQYTNIAIDKGMTVTEYLASPDAPSVTFARQDLVVEENFLIEEGEVGKVVQIDKLPKIFGQAEILTPQATDFGTTSYNGIVEREGTFAVTLPSVPGEYTASVTVENTDFARFGPSIAEGTSCVVNYRVLVASVDNVQVSAQNNATEVEEGGTVQFNVAVSANNADDSVTWTVTGKNDPNTNIDQNGKLTIGSEEPAGTELTIRATSNFDSNKYSEVTIRVVKKAVTITINPTQNVTVEIGSTKQFTKTITTQASNKNVEWSLPGNTNESITIDQTGKLTVGNNVAEGTEITVRVTSAYDNTKYAEATATVVKPNVTVTINNVDYTNAHQGDEVQFSATVTPSFVNGEVDWEVVNSTKSTFDENAKLTISEEEPAGSVLVVKATSKYDNTKYDTKHIVVIAKPASGNPGGTGDAGSTQTPGTNAGATSVREQGPEGKVRDIISNLATNGVTVTVKDKNGNTITSTTELSKTGMTIELSDGRTLSFVKVGDVNGDGEVTIADQGKITGYREKDNQLSATEFSAADINNDGYVDIIDAFLLNRYITDAGHRKYPDFSNDNIRKMLK